jgi:hypothetical protein
MGRQERVNLSFVNGSSDVTVLFGQWPLWGGGDVLLVVISSRSISPQLAGSSPSHFTCTNAKVPTGSLKRRSKQCSCYDY